MGLVTFAISTCATGMYVKILLYLNDILDNVCGSLKTCRLKASTQQVITTEYKACIVKCFRKPCWQNNKNVPLQARMTFN